MNEKIKLHRRIANLSRWQCQQAGSELAVQLQQLRRWQKQSESLSRELEVLYEEQLALLMTGSMDVQRHEATRILAAELQGALRDWEVAVGHQTGRVKECRSGLARARRKQRKSEDKHKQTVHEWHIDITNRGAAELEEIYIGNLGRSA